MEIKKVAVLGAGVMGSGIAAHVANAGIPVVLLDIVPQGSNNRNALAEGAIERMRKTNPAPLMHERTARLITPGNLEDHIGLLADCDWICEAVLERLDVKHTTYKKVDAARKKGSIVTSNTSTIPLQRLIEPLPKSFQEDFAITHFFNPPRYMRLFELVGGAATKPDVLKTLAVFGEINLGKEVVPCKDTPGFIANRIGIFWSMVATQKAVDLGLTVEDADAIVGRPMGIPKTGIFGLMDLTGIDLKPHVLGSMRDFLQKADAFHGHYNDKHPLNALTDKMIKEGYTGRKGKGGFYRLQKNGAERIKEAIDLKTGEYRVSVKSTLKSADAGKKGLRALSEFPDKGGEYAWQVLAHVLKYAADLVPEISDDIIKVDEAMKAGYAWKYGPFEQIDQLGTAYFAERLAKSGLAVPAIVQKANGRPFYREEGGKKQYLTVKGDYADLVVSEDAWTLADKKRGKKPIASNSSASIWDVGDGVACLEFHSKMNSLDANSVAMVKEAAKIDKKGFKALIIGNDSDNFSVGANIGLGLFAANTAMWPVLDQNIREGQDAYLALKYAPFPVVGAPAGMALGGGCEVNLHCSAVQAHAELYMGLVEVGVGLIPGWGGTKEMIMRHALNKKRPGGPMPPVAEAFQTIGLAKVSKSADEARSLLFLRETDGITMNRKRLLADAKKRALALLAAGYKPPPKDVEVSLPGATARVALAMAVNDLAKAGKATPHDVTVSAELAGVLSGGETDVTETVKEKDLLALERAAMARLFRNSRTLDRIEHMLETGKPLRN
ncbi:MAG: 3-hydroxyacyl-CoA dehydrogenase/enoyl-CoA hydratase family protein [Alphaproteobacteria bacterium]|nr:3-hydroxyacyl-CoA dehydrogenase/enoyl-CoA hydratase family protein [Alphaproteobacteria bacterium]